MRVQSPESERAKSAVRMEPVKGGSRVQAGRAGSGGVGEEGREEEVRAPGPGPRSAQD